MTTTFSATTSGVTTAAQFTGPRMSALLLGGSLGTRVISFLFFYYNKETIFLLLYIWLNVMQVESWECDLKVPNLPAATLMPGAALLGQAYYYLLQYTRHTICLHRYCNYGN
jgi:hypothetical protein